MSDPRQVQNGGSRAFAALDPEQRPVREAIADATAAAIACAAATADDADPGCGSGEHRDHAARDAAAVLSSTCGVGVTPCSRH